ncbi:THUMP domain-containing class I SAM-dependent RNA methyltransferase [Parachitinimonas caeni]|uniref:THUMP domain-containing protein n=1 Tax=Parachitinimonas caeni TaxID=3031301 RepID=A0ABT7DY99_9NEIS|nr:THUMP domain-containing protein [Parachitinimonas caeni]MDK2125021.1 THUMP domain-containing protein [Parachitinimonas caeni]
MKQTFRFFAPCPRGLESVLTKELQTLGARDIEATDGGAAFIAEWQVMLRANLESRVASRILWMVGEGPYRTEEDIYRICRKTDWAELFDVNLTLKVAVTGNKCPLRSLEFVALKVKDAVCDGFRARTGSRPSVDTHAPDIRIHAFLTDRWAQIYLDTSGEALFKRGYRQQTGEAPLRENLAAGILGLTGWQAGEPLLDPMCGSGTFLIEAAWMALNIPPGHARHFAFEKFSHFNPSQWENLRSQALSRAKPADDLLPIFGSDIDAQALDAAAANLDAAGLADAIRLSRRDVLEREAPADKGIWLSNPPYGVRLSEQEALAAFYPELGHALKRQFSGWRAFVFTADPMLIKLIRLSASRRTPLFNGALECRLYEFKLVAGSNRKPKADADE